jgi:hypothetical protein
MKGRVLQSKLAGRSKTKKPISKADRLFSVRMKGLEPPRLAAPDPKSGAATNYATSALRSPKISILAILQANTFSSPYFN